jgi:type IV secretion system protein VirB6
MRRRAFAVDAAAHVGDSLMVLCPQVEGIGLVGSVIDTVDCHIRILVQDSYRNLVGPDTWFAVTFTAMLTIYIALIGYQLMLGRGGLRVTELPATALKIGFIFAFLTSWAAYQTLVFDFLFDGPLEIMKVLIGPLTSNNARVDGDVMGSLQNAFVDMTGAAGIYGGMANPSANLLQGGPMLASGLLWLSALMMLLITLGLLVAVKLVLAFLLAIGPIFIGLFLFDSTRGLFQGWLRATISFALAPLVVSVLATALLMILSPFLEILVQNARLQEFDMGPIMTISLIVIVFAVVMLLGLSAVAMIGRSWGGGRPHRRDSAPLRIAGDDRSIDGGRTGRAERHVAMAAASETRMAASTATAQVLHGGSTRRSGEIADSVSGSPILSSARLGQAYQRSQRPHVRRGEES